MIDLERLLRIPYVDPYHGFDISPDGQWIAFAWNLTGEWEIYQLPLDSSNRHQPIPLTPSPHPGGADAGMRGAKFAPRYSPGGKRLAYVVDFDGGEDFHLFVHDLDDHSCCDLAPQNGYALQPNFCWSPDGAEIAFITNQSGGFDAYVMPTTGGAARCVLSLPHPAWDIHWSPDGRWLAVTFESIGQDYGIQLVSLDGEAFFPVSDRNGPLNAHNPAWSPDSKVVAFHSDAPNGFHQIGLFDPSTRGIEWLTEGKVDCKVPAWSEDGTMLTYIRAQGATDGICVRHVDAPPAYQTQNFSFSVGPGVHYKPQFTPDGRQITFIFNNPQYPPDLWKLEIESGVMVQLTCSLSREMEDNTGLLPEEIRYPALDGSRIPALLFKSRGAGPETPAVLAVHGGPNWHYQMEWCPFMIHLVSRGWTVLAPNYRGSTGYGRDWQYANRMDLGGIDTDDIAAGACYLIQAKLANPSRIAVTGRSHGGYLTLTSLTRYAELWVAGSGVVPFANWFTCHERSRDDLKHWDIEMMGDPGENRELWRERSPYFFLERVRVPVQLICGTHDPRCPAEDSIDTRDRLIELGKQVEFHLYEDEGHTFLNTENVIRSETQRVEFLARHLEP